MTLVAKREERTAVLPAAGAASCEDALVICPSCKAIQSVQISEGRLTPTRKFRQVGSRVYHDCGSALPCRILRSI